MPAGYPDPKPVFVYFHFRSPYCYLISKTLWTLVDDFHVQLQWRPLGGWNGRSAPERAKYKIPITRQDVARFCRRLGIPFNPPPITTDATLAGVGSLLAESKGVLRAYVVEMMRAEWAAGQDIGLPEVREAVAAAVGIDPAEYASFVADPVHLARLDAHWEEAQAKGVFGVPSIVIDDEVFWGNDRLDFVQEHLTELRLARR